MHTQHPSYLVAVWKLWPSTLRCCDKIWDSFLPVVRASNALVVLVPCRAVGGVDDHHDMGKNMANDGRLS